MEADRYQKILLAVDGSPRSLAAAHQAVRVARLSASLILLLHVRERVPEFLGEPYYQHMLEQVTERAENLLEPFVELLQRAGLRFETLVLEGDPARSICRAAAGEGCDLIVMGTRGFSDFEGLVLGSVCHKVLGAAPCPVLSVR